MAVEGVIVYDYSSIEELSNRFNAVLDEDIINNLLEIKKNNKFIRRRSPIRLKYKVSTASVWRNERDSENISENDKLTNTLISNLNKLSDKNYDVILDELFKVYNDDSDEIVKLIANTICEKAMIEKTYCNLYAKIIGDLYKKSESKILEYTQEVCNDFFDTKIELSKEFNESDLEDYQNLCKLIKEKTEFTGGFVFIANLFKYSIINYEMVKQYYDSLIKYTNIAPKEQIGKYIDAIISIMNNCGEDLENHDKDMFKENFISIVTELIQDKKRVIPKYRFKLMDIIEKYENGWKDIDNEGWQQV